MMKLAIDVIHGLTGRTLATAESCTGGGIGAALTAVPGASEVFKGGVISYCNEIKHRLLYVPYETLNTYGAVSEPTAAAMAQGARKHLQTDFGLSVTGLAGPGGDEFGHPVGTVFLGLDCQDYTIVREFHFSGDRSSVRSQAITAALELIAENL